MLDAQEASKSANAPIFSAIPTPKKNLRIKRVVNNLPYSCHIELYPIEGIDWIYYAALDSTDKRLFYKSEYPNTILPGFSIYDLDTDEKEIQIVVWPVIGTEVGNPTYFGPIPIPEAFYLGKYDLEVAFKKQADIALYQQLMPLIEKHSGKAALPGVVHVQEAANDVYLPSLNTIKLSPDRRNLVHELIHASRKQLLFANKKFKFDEETEMIEEFFAEGLSNMIKDELNLSKNTYLKKGAVYGSTVGYNYDYRISDPSLTTQNLQSSWGGILTLENSRYYLASEAFHKIAIEYFITTGKYFAKEFNLHYYDIVQRTLADPDKEMFYAICEQLLPTVEAKPTRQWLIDQKLFNSTIEPGEKIFMDIDDYYTHNEWLGITTINLYNTFENGSDWIDGKKQYNMNGKTVKVELINLNTGLIEYSEEHAIPKYKNGFGAIKLYFYHDKNSTGVPHFQKQDVERNIISSAIKVNPALYGIYLTSENTSRSYYRMMGECMIKGKSKILIANPFQNFENAEVKLVHQNRQGKRTVVQPQPMNQQMCAIEVPFIKNNNCEPGILEIQVNAGGVSQNFQRNIGYGGTHGGHQFLIGAKSNNFLPDISI